MHNYSIQQSKRSKQSCVIQIWLSSHKKAQLIDVRRKLPVPRVPEATGSNPIENPFLEPSSQLFILRLQLQW